MKSNTPAKKSAKRAGMTVRIIWGSEKKLPKKIKVTKNGELLVPFKRAEVERVIEDISSELASDMPGFVNESKPDLVLKKWRDHSPAYVSEKRKTIAADILRGRDATFDSESEASTQRMHDHGADLLEKLLHVLKVAKGGRHA